MDELGQTSLDDYGPFDGINERPPAPVDWNLLDADNAEIEWRDLDAWVTWLKTTFGLPPAVVPPYWHRHDELIWELSALHTHFLACHDRDASPSAPNMWMRDFADTRHRLRDWVSICGTRLDRDRPTRQTTWPGETETRTAGEVEIHDRSADFEEFVRADVLRRRRIQHLVTTDWST
ncbi:hypothetical protein KVF89_25630 [Nocardioides carbamazepini]|uniref:hypothetical protein n=1 Tax=Nocardioides carbamazepini TaxID=2854259 RepID=UPI00214A16FA|nr:hypothetical protein [Nocardioides carbamazepini]MCR1785942.1 hypothetical protein [Nocardioides carbamazepini]